MAQVKYVGGTDCVDINLPDGGTATVERGDTVELPDDVAAYLVTTTEFEAAKASKATADEESA